MSIAWKLDAIVATHCAVYTGNVNWCTIARFAELVRDMTPSSFDYDVVVMACYIAACKLEEVQYPSIQLLLKKSQPTIVAAADIVACELQVMRQCRLFLDTPVFRQIHAAGCRRRVFEWLVRRLENRASELSRQELRAASARYPNLCEQFLDVVETERDDSLPPGAKRQHVSSE